LLIRKYTVADLEEIVDIFTSSVHQLTIGYYDDRQRIAWAPLSPDLKNWGMRLNNVQTLVAEENGELMGFVSYEADGHIDLLFTSPNHERKGVASALYQEVESILANNGVREIYTEASLVALPFFKRKGFTVSEEEIVTRDGVELNRFAMRKTI
jgi:putative acetyltransferase